MSALSRAALLFLAWKLGGRPIIYTLAKEIGRSPYFQRGGTRSGYFHPGVELSHGHKSICYHDNRLGVI